MHLTRLADFPLRQSPKDRAQAHRIAFFSERRHRQRQSRPDPAAIHPGLAPGIFKAHGSHPRCQAKDSDRPGSVKGSFKIAETLGTYSRVVLSDYKKAAGFAAVLPPLSLAQSTAHSPALL
jgi:hypothetical protein